MNKSKQSTKEERKKKAQTKKDIVSDLKLNLLREKVVYYVQQLIIFNQISSLREFHDAISIITKQQLDEIIEERLSLRFCCNVKCRNTVSQEIFDKFKKPKLVILKSGELQSSEEIRIFCDKKKRQDKSQCEEELVKTTKQIEFMNDGGVFSTAFENVLQILLNFTVTQDQEGQTHLIDKAKIQETVLSFKELKGQICGPIVEKVNHDTKENSQMVQNQSDSKANANFKINVVSQRKPPATQQIDINQSDQQSSVAQDNQTQVDGDQKQKKKVRFSSEQVKKVQEDSDQEMAEYSDKTQSEGDEGEFDFEEMKKDLEKFRQNEMSSFQKLNDFFLTMMNDYVYFYINGKHNFESENSFENSSSRDFLLRQLKIQVEEIAFKEGQVQVKKAVVLSIQQEMQRILELMDISTLTYAFEQEEWKALTRIFLKLIQKRFELQKANDDIEQIVLAVVFIKDCVVLKPDEEICLDLFH